MKFPEYYRLMGGRFGTPHNVPYGAFIISRDAAPCNRALKVIADDGARTGWEHVSVSVAGKVSTRTPSWPEMDFVKHLFWHDHETVIQFHPAEEEKVNMGEILHLWRQRGAVYNLPPAILSSFVPSERPRIIVPA